MNSKPQSLFATFVVSVSVIFTMIVLPQILFSNLKSEDEYNMEKSEILKKNLNAEKICTMPSRYGGCRVKK